MNIKINKAILLISMASSLSAWAQSERGNGGDIISCGQASTRMNRFYDSFEAEQQQKKLIFTQPATFHRALADQMERLKRLDPVRYDYYSRNEFAGFLSEMEKIVERVKAGEADLAKINQGLQVTKLFPELKDLPDEGIASYTEGCTLQQLYIQFPKADLMGGRAVFNVSFASLKKIINQPNELALSVLHELFYRESALKGATDSRYARTLNQLLASDPSQKDYVAGIASFDSQSQFQMHYSIPGKKPDKFYQIDQIRNLNSGYQMARAGSSWVLIDQTGKPFAIARQNLRMGWRANRIGNTFIRIHEETVTNSNLPRTKNNREGEEFNFANTSSLKPLVFEKPTTSLYIFDLELKLRLVVDNQVDKIITDAYFPDLDGVNNDFVAKGKKIKHIGAVMEIKKSGDVISRGNTVDVDTFLKKISAEQ